VNDEATRAQAASGEAVTERPATGEGAAGGVNAGAWSPGESGPAGELAAAEQHPERAVAAAFGGGLLAAILLRRLASGD
jgi:hypothetical protein